jgi:hypothetical protein
VNELLQIEKDTKSLQVATDSLKLLKKWIRGVEGVLVKNIELATGFKFPDLLRGSDESATCVIRFDCTR